MTRRKIILGVLAGLLLAGMTVGDAGAQNAPIRVIVTPRGADIAAGATSQVLMAANASRRGLFVQNPCSAAEQGIGAAEDIVVRFSSAATLTTNVNTVVLTPCSSFGMPLPSGYVTSESVNVIATTMGHHIYAYEF